MKYLRITSHGMILSPLPRMKFICIIFTIALGIGTTADAQQKAKQSLIHDTSSLPPPHATKSKM
ncbi:MAG: hypothetical protein ABJA70_15310, partial [Chryseolinea sp.]